MLGLDFTYIKKLEAKIFLYDPNLSINYNKICNINSNLANSVTERVHENSGIYMPSRILAGSPEILCMKTKSNP